MTLPVTESILLLYWKQNKRKIYVHYSCFFLITSCVSYTLTSCVSCLPKAWWVASEFEYMPMTVLVGQKWLQNRLILTCILFSLQIYCFFPLQTYAYLKFKLSASYFMLSSVPLMRWKNVH